MKYIQIDEDEDVEELVKNSKRASDANLAWAPMKTEEQEDMKTVREPEDFI